MHVLQNIAVKADSKDEAFSTVKSYLETNMGEHGYDNWYDWFVTGGGRWNPNPDSQYNDNDQSLTISYEEDPQKFLETVETSITYRVEEFNRYRQYFNDKHIDLDSYFSSYDGHMKFDFSLYELSKMIDMIQGKWDYNTYIFDSTHDSTNVKYMLEDIDKGNKNWYIIPVDFHF